MKTKCDLESKEYYASPELAIKPLYGDQGKLPSNLQKLLFQSSKRSASQAGLCHQNLSNWKTKKLNNKTTTLKKRKGKEKLMQLYLKVTKSTVTLRSPCHTFRTM